MSHLRVVEPLDDDPPTTAELIAAWRDANRNETPLGDHPVMTRLAQLHAVAEAIQRRFPLPDDDSDLVERVARLETESDALLARVRRHGRPELTLIEGGPDAA